MMKKDFELPNEFNLPPERKKEDPTPPAPEIKQIVVANPQALVEYVAASGNELLKLTLRALIDDLNNTVYVKDMLRQAMGLVLQDKFAPLRCRISDIEKLPKGWDVEIHAEPNGIDYNIRFVAPNRSKGGLILLNGNNN